MKGGDAGEVRANVREVKRGEVHEKEEREGRRSEGLNVRKGRRRGEGK